MVIKLRRRFCLKSEPGLWALIHSHESRRGANILIQMILTCLAEGVFAGKGEGRVFDPRRKGAKRVSE